LVAVEVTVDGRHATQLLRIGAPVVASSRTPDTEIAAARTLVARWLGNGCGDGLEVTDTSGVGLTAASGVAATDEGDPDSEPLGVTGPSGVTEESGVAVGDDAPSDAAADGVAEAVGSAAAAKGQVIAATSATEAALTAILIPTNGKRECRLIAPPGVTTPW
jgi:hypothetical protein